MHCVADSDSVTVESCSSTCIRPGFPQLCGVLPTVPTGPTVRAVPPVLQPVACAVGGCRSPRYYLHHTSVTLPSTTWEMSAVVWLLLGGVMGVLAQEDNTCETNAEIWIKKLWMKFRWSFWWASIVTHFGDGCNIWYFYGVSFIQLNYYTNYYDRHDRHDRFEKWEQTIW